MFPKHVSDIELDLLATDLMSGKRNWTSTPMMKMAKDLTILVHGSAMVMIFLNPSEIDGRRGK